jgi:hypothetical protein
LANAANETRGFSEQDSQTRRGLYADRADDRDGDYRRAHVVAVPSFIGAIKHGPGSGAQGRPARDAGGHRLLHHGQAEGAAVARRPDQDGYLKAVPEDPFTHSKDTWVTETSERCTRWTRPNPASTTSTPARRRSSSDGQPYSTWYPPGVALTNCESQPRRLPEMNKRVKEIGRTFAFIHPGLSGRCKDYRLALYLLYSSNICLSGFSPDRFG